MKFSSEDIWEVMAEETTQRLQEPDVFEERARDEKRRDKSAEQKRRWRAQNPDVAADIDNRSLINTRARKILEHECWRCEKPAAIKSNGQYAVHCRHHLRQNAKRALRWYRANKKVSRE